MSESAGPTFDCATAADVATFLAVRDSEGAVVARGDLYLVDGVAQIDDVNTHVDHRGQGHASALVMGGVERAHAAGASTVLLIADADDWPQQLYRRLGFTDLCCTSTFTR